LNKNPYTIAHTYHISVLTKGEMRRVQCGRKHPERGTLGAGDPRGAAQPLAVRQPCVLSGRPVARIPPSSFYFVRDAYTYYLLVKLYTVSATWPFSSIWAAQRTTPILLAYVSHFYQSALIFSVIIFGIGARQRNSSKNPALFSCDCSLIVSARTACTGPRNLSPLD
jgi:hypothetical protein